MASWARCSELRLFPAELVPVTYSRPENETELGSHRLCRAQHSSQRSSLLITSKKMNSLTVSSQTTPQRALTESDMPVSRVKGKWYLAALLRSCFTGLFEWRRSGTTPPSINAEITSEAVVSSNPAMSAIDLC